MDSFPFEKEPIGYGLKGQLAEVQWGIDSRQKTHAGSLLPLRLRRFIKKLRIDFGFFTYPFWSA